MHFHIHPPADPRLRGRTGALLASMLLMLLAGCSSTGGGPLDKAMEIVGWKKPELPDGVPMEPPLLPRKVALRLHAGELLNTDGQGRSLSIVARVYKLRASTNFLQQPYEVFSGAANDRSSPLAQEVVEMRELTLTPGQRYEVIESLPPEATQLAVVALFRSPAEQRWRFVFDAKGSVANGITLGLHGCAMSVAEGQVIDAAPELRRLAGVRCK